MKPKRNLQKLNYNGKDISSLNREELIECVNYLYNENTEYLNMYLNSKSNIGKFMEASIPFISRKFTKEEQKMFDAFEELKNNNNPYDTMIKTPKGSMGFNYDEWKAEQDFNNNNH